MCIVHCQHFQQIWCCCWWFTFQSSVESTQQSQLTAQICNFLINILQQNSVVFSPKAQQTFPGSLFLYLTLSLSDLLTRPLLFSQRRCCAIILCPTLASGTNSYIRLHSASQGNDSSVRRTEVTMSPINIWLSAYAEFSQAIEEPGIILQLWSS